MGHRARLTLLGVGTVVLAGCSTGSGHNGPVTVTVTPPAHSSGRSGSHPSGSAKPTGSGIPTAAQRKLPGTCDDLLPQSVVETALGRSVPGNTAFVVGVPEKDIDRLANINCRYGLPAGPAAAKATPAVEIGVSLYGTAAEAAARVTATVSDFTDHGATGNQTPVGDLTGTVLTGGSGSGYAAPTIVASAGQRTVAVTMAASATKDPAKDLAALATVALQKTG